MTLKEQSATAARGIAGLMRTENARWKGAKVRVNSGKYKDRLAEVTGVIPDEREGLLFCCMVIRADGSGFLNSDGESRWYRPLRDFRMA